MAEKETKNKPGEGANTVLDEAGAKGGEVGNSGNEGGQGDQGNSGNEAGKGGEVSASASKSGKAGAKEKGGEEETVVVNKKDLQALMKKLDDQAEDIKTLYKVADKGRLDRFDSSTKEAALIKTARAWFFEDKLVIATKLVSNQSDVINGKAFEDQQLEVFFENGETQKMRYRDFEVHKEYRKAEIVGRKIEGDGDDEETFFKLQFPDGKKAELSGKFIN